MSEENSIQEIVELLESISRQAEEHTRQLMFIRDDLEKMHTTLKKIDENVDSVDWRLLMQD
ncbi:hypothetical protein F4X10_03685 [Candidatus Poribacteria bacterium]|nr:hypothetical protein [Candidatus Poribacteria bacterium]